MKSKLILTGLLGLFTLAMPSCSSDEEASDFTTLTERKPIELSRSGEQVRNGNISFSFSLIDEILQDERYDNFIVSPLGAGYALSALSNGTKPIIANEICAALGGSIEETSDFYTTIVNTLPECDNTIELKQAFSLWINYGSLKLTPDFEKFLTEKFGIEYFYRDDISFSNDFNAWVKEHSFGNAPKFSMTNTAYAFANVIAFDGKWAQKSKNISKKSMDFKGVSKTSKHDFLSIPNSYFYKLGNNTLVAQIPYGNMSFALEILVPEEGTSLQQMAAQLKETGAKQLTELVNPNICSVEFPMFKIESNIDFVPFLKNIGINELFNLKNREELEDIAINVFTQGTALSISKDGTKVESATVAALILGASGLKPQKPNVVTIDRPFLYLIREWSTGTVLFAGAVTDL